ncbi:MAG: peptidoglycan DD-metalloendopeptidase family protein [Candidatus Nitrotoga sp.]
MTVNRAFWSLAALLEMLIAVSGCALREGRSSVWERERSMVAKKSAVSANEKDWRPDVHVVQKGETLYGIAFNYGLDYHEIAELNDIPNPKVIRIGQELRLFASVRPSGGSAPTKPITENEPSENISTAVSSSTISPPINSAPIVVIKEQPIALKLDYSGQAVAQIEKLQAEQLRFGTKTPAHSPAIQGASTSGRRAQIAEVDDSKLDWGLPAQGKWSNEFSGGNNQRGIDIVGKLGQPVVASAAGKVVYSGSGLRGYGNLVIIKHNKTFISAYAHNNKIVVKEGHTVSKGQKIAEMGNTDTNQVKLHFEIRKFGKPVDPANFLSLPRL